ncbi:type II toxin-antitoxin system RelE/ParE family toxin [Rhizobium sp. XQZ8]|uniref:type II toxin-antitoxin system RelE family toxin n=1 Tax=Rhizobium populisoli TaxID=2859785 RepID=UPI001C671787|nr:type II toxin-antitoxin system RelE/ParE family toxin [Rhizobium populisoli]MBW6423472.1 type II toxin-antitoxin system RelE/ParE family toxin [Rhizobium populisoli]
MRIEWHVDAVKDLKSISTSDKRRIKKVLDELSTLGDPRQKLVAYSGNLKDFWKLRVGDYRLVCQIKLEAGEYILIIRVAHRSVAYDPRSVSRIDKRSK